MEKYELEIISHHPDFEGKTLRQYSVDGIKTVGSYGQEAFEVKFRNNTLNKVQIRLSIDGTDVISGKPATTEPTGEMWSVLPWGTISLRAWPEGDDGGAAFAFTSANNSVAVHTHGDLSCRGIIAAAVFEEGAPSPATITVERHDHYHNYPWYVNLWVYPYYPYVPSVRPYWDTLYGTTITCNNSSTFKGGGSYNATITSTSCNAGGGTMGACYLNSVGTNSSDDSVKSLDAGPACGAGDYTIQKISHVQGLIKPVFTETVKVRYLWWDDLQAKLREQQNAPSKQPSGFPGDRPKGIDLGSTPRIGSASGAPRRTKQVFSRV
jgi:hypothetical protein